MHLQPLYSGYTYYPCGENGNSIADRLFEQGICLPSGSNLEKEDQDRVIEVIRKTIKIS